MARFIPVLVLGTLAAASAVWGLYRLYQDLTKPPKHPEATTQQLLDHLKVKAYFLVEGFTRQPLPVQLDFPTLHTVIHVGEDFQMRYKTKGYTWTPLTDPSLSHAVQFLLLSE